MLLVMFMAALRVNRGESFSLVLILAARDMRGNGRKA